MRIVDIRETTITLSSPIRNAEIRFDAMTASAIALVTDHVVGGKPVIGLGFDSIGRYGHGGLLKERFAPRVLAASPEDYQDAAGLIDPERLWAVAMRNEKPGGHGERAGAVGLLDAAAWDAVAKAQGRPLWHLLAERYNGGAAPGPVPVYGSGGHYRDGDDGAALADELRLYQRKGHTRFKVKIGGLPPDDDRRRLDAALAVSGREGQLAVDGSGTSGARRRSASPACWPIAAWPGSRSRSIRSISNCTASWLRPARCRSPPARICSRWRRRATCCAMAGSSPSATGCRWMSR